LPIPCIPLPHPGVNWIAVYLNNNPSGADAGFDLDLQYEGASSGAAPSLEAPGPVTGAAAAATSKSAIRLTWSKPACEGSSFVTRYSFAVVPAKAISPVVVSNPFTNSYSLSISGLTACRAYSFTITATNAAGDSTGVTVSATTLGCARRSSMRSTL